MDSDFFCKISVALSPDRLSVYRQDGADERITLARYLWNIALCETLYSPLQMAEIALRNAANQAFSQKFNVPDWYDKAPLTPWAHLKVGEAKRKIADNQKRITPGRVISELHFGFWTSFFNNYHAQTGLGACLLKKGFRNCPKSERNQKSQEKRWNEIRLLRNRIFHHERIIHWTNLSDQHKRLLELIGWISPEIKDMSLRLDRFLEIYKAGIDPWKEKIQNHWPKDK